MAYSVVNSNVSSLESCLTDIGTAMDLVTSVAFDLVETEGSKSDLQTLEQMMMNCAGLEREIKSFINTVKDVTAQARAQESPLPLKSIVEERFKELKAGFSDAELCKHRKLVAFKNGLRQATREPTTSGLEEELDDDIAVTQSMTNFTCPLTQVAMVNPVRNKKCNHYYEHEAVLSMIRDKQSKKKNFRCPVVGCGNQKVKESDLVPDTAMKRVIQQQKKQGTRT